MFKKIVLALLIFVSFNCFSISIKEIGDLRLRDFIPSELHGSISSEIEINVCSTQNTYTFFRVQEDRMFASENDEFYLAIITFGKNNNCQVNFEIQADEFKYIRIGDVFSSEKMIQGGYRLLSSENGVLEYFKFSKVLNTFNGINMKGLDKRISVFVELKKGVVKSFQYGEGIYD